MRCVYCGTKFATPTSRNYCEAIACRKKELAAFIQAKRESLLEFIEVPIDKVSQRKEQSKAKWVARNLLIESIKKNGMIKPILVRVEGDRYRVIDGYERFVVAKELGFRKIKVRIVTL